jgi:glutathione S-transferase
MRARMALLVCGTVFELREIKLSAKPPEMIAASPKATVPVLVLPDGRVLDESLDIMRWALGTHDPAGWLAGDDTTLIAANDGPFKHHLDRYKYADRHGSDGDTHRAAALGHVERLEDRLTVQTYLSGSTFGLTDAAILPFVRQFAEVDRAWFDAQPLPRVHAWLAQYLDDPLFEAVMARFPMWSPDDTPVLIEPPAGIVS